MALTVEGDARQSFTAMFELEGVPALGQLTLNSPLGNRLAQLVWSPAGAQLTSAQGNRTASSLEELLAQSLGSAVPVEALFAWLQGSTSEVEGWKADLSELASGRLVAVREQPAPRATLRLVLDR